MLPDNTRVMGKFREGAFVPPSNLFGFVERVVNPQDKH